MNAVGKLGSYISRGVYTVSGPFHPFGGAVDIIVVQQPDGSFKSSPWYIRFGKFQGVLKTKEKIVSISVNGVEAGFHMYLDHKGEAHFLKESDTEEGEVVIFPQTSGGEREERLGDTVEGEVAILPQTLGSEREEGLRDTEGGEVVISSQTSEGEREEILGDAQFRKIQSYKYDRSMRDSVAPNGAQNGKILNRTTSRRSRILGLMFGRRSMKKSELNRGVDRVNSLERAEIAADLLELKWSTNLLDSNGSPKKPTDKTDFFPKKSTGEKEEKQQSLPLDVEQDCDGKTVYSGGSFVDNFGTSIVGREHFEERVNFDSMNLGEETTIEINSSRRQETTLGTVSINQVSQESAKNCTGCSGTRLSTGNHESRGNFDRMSVTEVLFEEKNTCTSGLSGHEEVLEIYTMETVGSAESNESTSNPMGVKGFEVNVLSKDSNLGDVSFDVQSSDAPAILHDTLQEVKETFEASAFGASSNGSGEQETTCCKDLESSPVCYNISSKRTSRTSHLLKISPISIVGDKLKEDSEVLDDISSVGLHQNFELSDSVSSDAQIEPLVNGTFLCGEVSAEVYPSGKAGLLNSDSGTSYQDVVIEKHTQEIDSKTSSFPDNQQEKDIYSQPCSNGLLTSDQKTVSDSDSKSYCIGNFYNLFNESSQLNKIGSFEKNGVKSSCLSDMLNISQDTDASSRPIEVEAKVKSSESSEEDQFLFSDLDGFGFNETKVEVSFKVADENDKIHLLYTECDGVEGQTLKDVSDEELSEGLIEESVTQTSPMTIPRNKTYMEDSHISPKSLPAIRSNIHDLERSHRPHPLSSSLDVIFEKTKGDLSRLKCSSTLNMDDRSQSKVLQDYCTYEAVASTLDTKNDHTPKGVTIHPVVELSLCRHLLYEGIGLGAASQAFNFEKVTVEKFHALGPSLLKNDKLVARIGGHYLPWNSAAPIVLQIILFGQEPIFEPQDVILVERVEKNGKEDASLNRVLSEGSWNLWPFGFRRSKTIKFVQSTHESINQVKPIASSMTMKSLNRDNNGMQKPKNMKKKVRWLTPSSEELTSLNLKEGSNLVTFSFSTAMLGRQQVDARIYLWKWNTQIVISDVDGTITRSDVLGQFMPLVGIDWSQTGVAHLFSAIKENGYQLLFLSARAISQAYLTRQFLFNLKQDGKVLPHGPVVMSPDGLFPSLYREVIRRAPHEFKISCLEAIKALFPIDCNPFYAGFGNRDTDEVSYLKVGIPRGKIFIINPKGEVAVNRRIDTRSYTSLHALVNGMFPPMSSREQEDFNSWNFWKMPLPEIAI